MKIIDILDTEGKKIKHLRPIKYRKLKRLIRDYANEDLRKEVVTTHLHYYDGEELWADIYIYKDEKIEYLETVQTFGG